MNLKKKLGSRIKIVRLKRKITQEKLAEKIGISPQSLSQLERGDNFLSADVLEKLCLELNVRPSVIFDFEIDLKNAKNEDINVDKEIMDETLQLIKENPSKVYMMNKLVKFLIDLKD